MKRKDWIWKWNLATTVVAVATLGTSTSLEAHCGACGSGTKHAKTKHEHKDGNHSTCSSSEAKTASASSSKPGNIVEVASSAGSFKTLVAAVEAAGLVDALSGEGPFTVFAPTDDAFDALPDGAVEALLNDLPKLRSILKYHVVPGRVTSDKVVTLKTATSFLGQKLDIDTRSGVRVEGASVVKADIPASNGVIHVIDRVIMPEPDIVDIAGSAGTFSTLLKAAKAAGMLDTLRGKGPLTVFAPTDDAFEALPTGTLDALLKDEPKLRAILKYHVVSGQVMASDVVKLDEAKTVLGQNVKIKAGDQGVKVNDASVLKADIVSANGVIHVIDKVLLPAPDVVDVAESAGSFNTLLAAVKAAGLEDTLRGEGPFTVFAPTDAAFARLPEGTVEALLKDVPKLKSILTYHVVAGNYPADKLADKSSVKTIQGESLSISTQGGVRIDSATVTKADIATANGTIHVIDEVVLPKQTVSKAESRDEKYGG